MMMLGARGLSQGVALYSRLNGDGRGNPERISPIRRGVGVSCCTARVVANKKSVAAGEMLVEDVPAMMMMMMMLLR